LIFSSHVLLLTKGGIMNLKTKLNTKLLSIGPVLAGKPKTDPAPKPSITPEKIEPQSGNFSLDTLIQNIINWIFWIIAFIALAGLVYGAFLYITAGGDAEKTTKARNVILYALLGILILATANILISWVVTGNAFHFFTGSGTAL
jgi:hypothetical protein